MSFLGIPIRSNEIFIRFGGKAKPSLFHFLGVTVRCCGSVVSLVPLMVDLDQLDADPEARLLIAGFYGLNANI